MIKTSIERLSYDIGYDIGMSDDETQAKLLNGLCEALSNSMGKNQLGTQLCYISSELTDKSVNVLKELVEYINLKNDK